MVDEELLHLALDSWRRSEIALPGAHLSLEPSAIVVDGRDRDGETLAIDDGLRAGVRLADETSDGDEADDRFVRARRQLCGQLLINRRGQLLSPRATAMMFSKESERRRRKVSTRADAIAPAESPARCASPKTS